MVTFSVKAGERTRLQLNGGPGTKCSGAYIFYCEKYTSYSGT